MRRATRPYDLRTITNPVGTISVGVIVRTEGILIPPITLALIGATRFTYNNIQYAIVADYNFIFNEYAPRFSNTLAHYSSEFYQKANRRHSPQITHSDA